MSFSSEIKEKLCTHAHECPCCAAAETAGLFCVSGNVGGTLKFKTENPAVAERAAYDINECSGIKPRITEGARSKSLAAEGYDAENLGEIIRGVQMPLECCKCAYLRGAFLGGGSVSDPSKAYHLEIGTRDGDTAQRINSLMREEGFPSKVTSRKGAFVVYLKGCEAIADFLGYMGAAGSALEVFTVQIEKEMRNNVNRRVNCESANADKLARAASRHIFAVEKIKAAGKWEKLPDALKEIGDLRSEYPEDSLKELGARLDPPIGKSGVNHRLNRLLEFADEL